MKNLEVVKIRIPARKFEFIARIEVSDYFLSNFSFVKILIFGTLRGYGDFVSVITYGNR